MGHLACFVTGMFALEAKYEKNEERKRKVMQLAEVREGFTVEGDTVFMTSYG